MASKVQVLLVDDMVGGDADETVTFALDGKHYEIDLNTQNAEKLRGTLADFVAAGRRTGTTKPSRRPVRPAHSADGYDTAKIRAWAKENGWSINDRGRVPGNVIQAYKNAHA